MRCGGVAFASNRAKPLPAVGVLVAAAGGVFGELASDERGEPGVEDGRGDARAALGAAARDEMCTSMDGREVIAERQRRTFRRRADQLLIAKKGKTHR